MPSTSLMNTGIVTKRAQGIRKSKKPSEEWGHKTKEKEVSRRIM